MTRTWPSLDDSYRGVVRTDQGDVSIADFVREVGAPIQCGVCAYAVQHGWFGLRRGTHCRACHRSWSAGSHCYECCQHFSSGWGFDRHQVNFTCRSLAGVCWTCTAPKFRLDNTPDGPIWVGTMHAEVCRNPSLCLKEEVA